MSDLFASLKDWDPEEPGTVRCPLCERKFSKLLFNVHLVFEKKQLAEIKKSHPDWTETDGACFPCINEIRKEFKLPELTKEECAPLIRITK